MRKVIGITALLLTLVLCIAPISHALASFNNLQRPATLVEKSKGAFVLDGFRWGVDENMDPIFKRTTIQPELIKDIYYWSENFPPEWLAAHGMLGFVMKNKHGVVAEDGTRDIGFAVSIEARTRTDQKYSLFKGLKRGEEGFQLIYQVSGYTDVMQVRVSKRKHTLEQYRLLLTEEQKIKMVKNALNLSIEDWQDEFYHTLKKSCVTGALEIINTVLPEDNKIKFWIIPKLLVNLKVSFPKWSYKYLMEHKIAVQAEKRYYKDRIIEILSDDGDDFRLDLSELPGFYVEADVLHFAENVDLFFEFAQAIDMLTRLQDLTPPSNPNFWMIQKEMVDVSDTIAEIEEGLFTIAKENFEKNLKYYISLEFDKIKSKNGIRYLNQKLLEMITYKLMHQEWEDRNFLLEAKKSLTGMEL